MASVQDLERGLAAYERRDWQEAYDVLSACESLTAGQIDLLADSAHWVGRPDETIAAYERAYELHLADGNGRRAALSAFMTAIFLRLRGEGSQADGWQSARCGSSPTRKKAPSTGTRCTWRWPPSWAATSKLRASRRGGCATSAAASTTRPSSRSARSSRVGSW